MKFLLAGYFGFGNFGDEAILKYAVDILRYYYNNAEISVLTNDPILARQDLEVNGVKRFCLTNILKEISSCNFLIFPGGSVLQDVTSLKSLIYYLGLIFLALLFKKKVILIAQGFGPVKNTLARKLTYKILKKVSLITLRDEKSYDDLMRNGVLAEHTADLLWAFTQRDKNKDNEQVLYGDIGVVEKKKIGIQLRSWPSLNQEKLEIIAKTLIRNFFYLEYEFKLISLQKNSDEKVLIELGKIIHKLQPKYKIELLTEQSIEKNIELLQSMDYMIAMRFHAGLCTINSEHPLLMLSYDPKTEEFCNELGLEYIDIDKLDEKTFSNAIKWLQEFNPTRTALKTNILVKKAQYNVDFLVKEIEQ